MGLFSILQDWLSKGENASKFKIKKKQTITQGDKIIEKEVEENKYLIHFLEKNEYGFELKGRKKGTVLYHLLLLQMLQEAKDNDKLYTYHFVLLRQVLESISSFLGEGRFGYVLSKLNLKNKDIGDINMIPDKINHLSHEKVYTQKLSVMGDDNKKLFVAVFDELIDTFHFSIK